jgi:hypothetical protein
MPSGSSNRAALLSLLALIAALSACAKDSPTSPSAATKLAFGTWGGNHAQVVASDTLTHVLSNCTFGDFPGNIPLDANGRFAVDGTYMLYTVPVQLNAPFAAQLSGQVIGNTLTFAIAVNDTIAKRVVSLGPQVVELGRQATIAACPV